MDQVIWDMIRIVQSVDKKRFNMVYLIIYSIIAVAHGLWAIRMQYKYHKLLNGGDYL